MRKSIKQGFGFTIGATLACTCMSVVKKSIAKSLTKDEEFMKWEKEHCPALYEKLKKMSK